jgi:hypothetical protein
MQQRRVRLGDILDDYCPRERRVTNHAVVAMVEDDVKQTRCTTCDAEHEYKHAKVPAPRRRKPAAALADRVDQAKPRVLATESEPEPEPIDLDTTEPAEVVAAPASPPPTIDAEPDASTDVTDVDEPADTGGEDEWGHRPLIRATLPRPEGQVPERKAPDFTIRQPGAGRGFDRNRPGQRQHAGGHRPMRHSQGQGQGGGPQGGGRFGGQRQGGGSAQGQRSGHPQRHGSGSGPGSGHTGGGRPGQPRGQRSGGGGQGGGRKRGR